METIRNINIESGIRESKPSNFNDVRKLCTYRKSPAGTCPYCKNFIVKRTSKERCKLCHAVVTWNLDSLS